MLDAQILNDTAHSLYRTSFPAFFRRSVEELFPDKYVRFPAYMRAMAFQIERILEGHTQRLIINLPPRYYKSTMVSVVLPAFLLGQDPSLKIVVVSYGTDLATELHNLTRELVQSPWYKLVFPQTQVKQSKNTESVFKTTKNGGRKAVSLGGGITGFGADFIICDDLMKPEDALSDTKRAKINAQIQNTLLSRLDDKESSVMISVMQRVHPNDTTGHLLQFGQWEHLKLPAIATTHEEIPIGDGEFFVRESGDPLDPERDSLETLDKVRSEMGETAFQAQMQQEPVPPGGAMFKLEKFKRYKKLLPPHFYEMNVQVWDPAVTASETSDYSACLTVAKRGDEYHVVDVFRKKMDYPELQNSVEEQILKFKPRIVIIEGSHIGKALLSTFDASAYSARMKKGDVWFWPVIPTVSKEERAAVQLPKIEQGRVFLPEQADWLPAFEEELIQFPMGQYDDQVDCLVHFLRATDGAHLWKLIG